MSTFRPIITHDLFESDNPLWVSPSCSPDLAEMLATPKVSEIDGLNAQQFIDLIQDVGKQFSALEQPNIHFEIFQHQSDISIEQRYCLLSKVLLFQQLELVLKAFPLFEFERPETYFLLNNKKENVLIYCIRNEYLSLLYAIFDRIPHYNLFSIFLCRDHQGYNLLHWSCKRFLTQFSLKLISVMSAYNSKSLFDVTDDGHTALEFALIESDEKTALALTHSMAKISIEELFQHTNSLKQTPLHIACEMGLHQAALALISYTSSTDIFFQRDLNGNSPIRSVTALMEIYPNMRVVRDKMLTLLNLFQTDNVNH